jgi:CheY-like chemotaxis protein
MSQAVLDPASKAVLVVDDDEFSQQIILGILEELGIADVHLAGDGREGLRALAQMPRTPDFLICDLFMPDMDGIEFLAQLGKQGYKGGIILVTGGDVSMLAIARDLAFADGLRLVSTFVKPLNHVALAQVMGVGVTG